MELLSKCKAVLVPLNQTIGDISAGQLVVLQGMMLRKIVVCTSTATTREYINSCENGILIDNNIEEAINIIKRIDAGEFNYIKDNAREFYLYNYSGENIVNAVIIALEREKRS